MSAALAEEESAPFLDLPTFSEFASPDKLPVLRQNAAHRAIHKLFGEPWRRAKERPGATSARVIAALGGSAAGAAIALGLGAQYYHAEIAGIEASADISPDLTGSGQASIFTNAGSIGAKPFGFMPLNLTLKPQITSVDTVKQIAEGPEAYVSNVECASQDEILPAALYFGGLALGGLLAGGIAAGGAVEFFTSKKWERGKDGYPTRLLGRAVGRSALSSVIVVASIGGAMAATYQPDWKQTHTSTGLIAAAEQIPGKIQELASRDQQAAAYALSAITVYDALTQPAPYEDMPKTAYNIAFISDTHGDLEGYYTIAGMIKEKNIEVVVNTGDETEFGLTQELTPEHIAAIRAITDQGAIMTFNIGNHGNQAIGETLAKIPGVYVFTGNHKILNADGLQIAGAPDPMGDQPEGGTSLTASQNLQLESEAAKQTAAALNNWQWIDIFQTHEPWMADGVAQQLNTIREIAAGHVHEQNVSSDVQNKIRDYIRLIEGTTGKNGNLLRYLPGGKGNGVMSLSLEGVSTDCQFTQVTRMQITDQTLPILTPNKLPFPPGVIAQSTTIGLRPQKIADGRQCGANQGVGWLNANDSEQALQSGKGNKALEDAKIPLPNPDPTPQSRLQVLGCPRK